MVELVFDIFISLILKHLFCSCFIHAKYLPNIISFVLCPPTWAHVYLFSTDVKETGLIPADPDRENEQPQLESSYNFISECFFMCHYCLHLGFHTVHERFLKLNQDLHRIQSVYTDIVSQGGENSDTGVRIKEQMETGVSCINDDHYNNNNNNNNNIVYALV